MLSEDFQIKFKIILTLTVLVVLILALVYGLYNVVNHSSQTSPKPNLYTDSNLNVTKVVTTKKIDYGTITN